MISQNFLSNRFGLNDEDCTLHFGKPGHPLPNISNPFADFGPTFGCKQPPTFGCKQPPNISNPWWRFSETHTGGWSYLGSLIVDAGANWLCGFKQIYRKIQNGSTFMGYESKGGRAYMTLSIYGSSRQTSDVRTSRSPGVGVGWPGPVLLRHIKTGGMPLIIWMDKIYGRQKHGRQPRLSHDFSSRISCLVYFSCALWGGAFRGNQISSTKEGGCVMLSIIGFMLQWKAQKRLSDSILTTFGTVGCSLPKKKFITTGKKIPPFSLKFMNFPIIISFKIKKLP